MGPRDQSGDLSIRPAYTTFEGKRLEVTAEPNRKPSAGQARPAPQVCGRILVTITEDWFALSHFKPLLAELNALAEEVVVATGSSGRLDELRALGVRAVEFDMRRGALNPLVQADVRRRLARLIDQERPDAVHAIALQPILLSSLAVKSAHHKPRALVLHVTGLGYIGVSRAPRARLVRTAAFGLNRYGVHGSNVWLLAENPDDISFVRGRGIGRRGRSTILPGAGVNPEWFAAQEPPDNAVTRVAYVGRLIRSKGVETLVAAHRLLRERGLPLDLALYGAPDTQNPDAVTRETLEAWTRQPGLTWHGHVNDVREVWRQSDIAAFPTLGGEGVPRSLLEAAACARPLVASNVSGCRHFVRENVEGLLVPPGDAEQLAAALEHLTRDRGLRRRQGEAARRRLVEGYTDKAVSDALRGAYRAMFAG
jgi:glycosyltransferase involved in cell wall biosynthesis